MRFVLKPYRISSDEGKTWAEEWLTDSEAAEFRKSKALCVLRDKESFKELEA